MRRMLLLFLTLLLALPSVAGAYNVWSITRSASPSSQAGIITPPPNVAATATAGGYSTATGSMITYVTSSSSTNTATAPAYADFTITAPAAGLSISSINIDGVKVGSTPGVYRVNKGSRSSHTINVVCTTATVSITASAVNGTINPLGTSTITYNTGKSYTITPFAGYALTDLTVNGVTDTAALAAGKTATAGGGSYTYTFSNVTSDKTLVAIFGLAEKVEAKIEPVPSSIFRGDSLLILASNSSSTIPVTYVWSVTPTTKVAITGTAADGGKTATFSSAADAALGSYTVTLQLQAAGVVKSSASVIINLEDRIEASVAYCQSCHITLDPTYGPAYETSPHKGKISCVGCHNSGFHPPQVTAIVCSDCHNPAHSGLVATGSCNECHNSHSAVAGNMTPEHMGGTVLVRAQYLSSNVTCSKCHAGSNDTILAAFKRSAHGDVNGEAWWHYDWRTDDRGACQRCHNGTAFVAKLNDVNNATTIFTAADAGKPGEVLNCSACHADVATGVLRTATPYSATLTNGAVITFNDLGPSNLCVRCHSGRETGDSIKLAPAMTGDQPFINSHYLSAGGTLFNKTGYEYEGRSYDSFGYHKNVGLTDVAGTGTGGPCVACHMTGPEPHAFEVITRESADGPITGIVSTVCANCHGGLTASILTASRDQFLVALQELKASLLAKGIEFKTTYPYFYVAGTGTAFTAWDAVYPGKGKDVMGAAFNYNLLAHDPGAYAHNRGYALQLIQDSIDLLADGRVDGLGRSATVTAIINSKDFAAATSHVPGALANPGPTTCGACHSPAPHYGGNSTTIPQYVYTGASCSGCHANGDTTANATVLSQYAGSGHGDISGTWRYEENGPECQRCHTTRGYIADMETPGTPVAFGPDDVLEVLACDACHVDLTLTSYDSRRYPGEYTAIWSANNVTATVYYPRNGDSNLCIRCHSGRSGGVNVTVSGTTTAHNLPAAAIVFGGTRDLLTITANTAGSGPAVARRFTGGGYEFTGQDYRNLGLHKNIHSIDGGACVGCHMQGTNGHSWNAVTTDEVTGEITAVNSTACLECHSDGSGQITKTPSLLNGKRAAFRAAVDELAVALASRGIHWYSGPTSATDSTVISGFFTAPYNPNGTTTAVTNAFYAQKAAEAGLSTMDLQGAAYNLWLFTSRDGDRAAWIHNPKYALKLLGNSVDYLNDGSIDGDPNLSYSLFAAVRP